MIFGWFWECFERFWNLWSSECTTSFAGPLSHSDGLTTLQVPEALHEGSIQKATAHLRSMGPVKWLNIHQLLMVSYKPYKPPSSPSSSDLQGNTVTLFVLFQVWGTQYIFWVKWKVIEHLQRSESPNKKFVPTIPNGSHSSSGKYTLHLSKHPTYWLIQYLGTSWRPPGSTSSAVCFFGRFGAERWFGAEQLLSQVDPGSPEFGCSFLKIQVPWQQNLPFQACDNW